MPEHYFSSKDGQLYKNSLSRHSSTLSPLSEKQDMKKRMVLKWIID